MYLHQLLLFVGVDVVAHVSAVVQVDFVVVPILAFVVSAGNWMADDDDEMRT